MRGYPCGSARTPEHKGENVAKRDEVGASVGSGQSASVERLRTRPRSRTGRQRPRRRVTSVVVAVLIGLVTIGGVIWLALQQTSTGNSGGGLAAGSAAPDRTVVLPSTQGGTIALQQLSGHKVVIFFYEGSTCGACQVQLTQLQHDLPAIHAAGGTVVGVSVDPVLTSRSLASQLHLGYPIAQDVNHQLGSAFADFHLATGGMDMGPVDNHAIFVLDTTGVLRWKAMAGDTMSVADEDVIAALQRIS